MGKWYIGISLLSKIEIAEAAHLIEAGVDLPTVQRLLGHGYISTTMRYVHLVYCVN